MRYHIFQFTQTGKEKANKNIPLAEVDVTLFGTAATFVEAVCLREGIPVDVRFANNIVDTCPDEPMAWGYK
ncbi:MAG: hypothetical protein H6669_07205 [Ardenticatenaceae bacterium]|nr:hypothetical protein [Ardenticatenaceae bacterium]